MALEFSLVGMSLEPRSGQRNCRPPVHVLPVFRQCERNSWNIAPLTEQEREYHRLHRATDDSEPE